MGKRRKIGVGRKPAFGKKLFFSFLATLLFLAALEAGVRLVWSGSPILMEFSGLGATSNNEDPVSAWKASAHQRVEIDHHGFSFFGTGEKKIVTLSDSCGIINRFPWPEHLGRGLNREGYDTVVVNGSAPGFSSEQGLRILESKILLLHPDTVIFVFGWNDHWRWSGMTDRQSMNYLLNRPGLKTIQLIGTFKARLKKEETPVFRVSPEQYKENLSRVVRLCRDRQVRLILPTVPHNLPVEGFGADRRGAFLLDGDHVYDLHGKYNAIVREVAQPAGALFDLEKEMRQLAADRPDLQLFRKDAIHFTEIGSISVANLYLAFLKTHLPAR